MNLRRFAPVLTPALALFLLLPALPARLPAQTISNPDLFGKSLEAAKEAIEQYGLYDNPAELARVNRIGYEIAQQADFQKFPISFILIDMAEPNSMTLPGGQIFVTRGMLDLGLDDDMLAALLGHETGHLLCEHFLHMQRRATLMNVLSNVLVAGVLIGSSRSQRPSGVEGPYDPRLAYDYGDGHGNLVQGAAAASLVISELLLRSYSRDNEDQADQVGQRLAAAAGYRADGGRRLFELMNRRMPQIKEYGYLQTHPFFDERVRAAEARQGSWSLQPKRSTDAYRQHTQEVLYRYASHQKVKEAMAPHKHPNGRPPGRPPESPEAGQGAGDSPARHLSVSDFLEDTALTTWPQGKTADTIRLERLHRQRDTELAKTEEARDYGALLRAYRKELAEVRRLDPKSELPALLDGEIAEFDGKRQELYPRARAVLAGGVFETSFLVAFTSNFPDAPERPQAALALGEAYSRLGNQSDAVAKYLEAWKAAPESAYGKRASAGLRNLAGNLKELSALQQLSEQDRDPEIRRLAAERLAKIAKTYDDLANGAEYLRRYPDGKHVVAVLDRLNVLADNLYGEVVLYQGFGDAAKATERINKILTNAPLSRAAERLRDRAVLAAEKAG